MSQKILLLIVQNQSVYANSKLQQTTKGNWCELREQSPIKYIKTVVSNRLLLTACLSRRIHFVTLETLWRDAIAFHVIQLKKRVQLNAFSFFSYEMVNTLSFGLFSVLNVSFYDLICLSCTLVV